MVKIQATQYWREGLQLESADLVKRLYKKIHGRELNTTRARQIVASYLQGKEYYRNSEVADVSVQPLLLFYGVSSLARALTLLLRQGGGEETLTQGHGLTCTGWNNVLTADVEGGLGNLGSLEVQSCGGTFTDLLSATENRSYLHVHSGKVDWWVGYPIPNELKIVFSDVVRRIPDVRTEYELWADSASLALYVHNMKRLENTLMMEVRKKEYIDESVEYADGTVEIKEQKDFMSLTMNWSDVPIFLNSFVDRMFNLIPMLYFTPPLAGKLYIPQIPMTFILSYYLGMMCRYYPSHWIGLSRLRIGDQAWPLMQASITYLEKAFPQLVMEYIQERAKNAPAA